MILFYTTISTCGAAEYIPSQNDFVYKKVTQTGYRILNANQIEKRVTFDVENKFKDKDKIKASSDKKSRSALLHSAIVPYIDDENELAAVISYKIANQLQYRSKHSAKKFDSFPLVKGSKADLVAVDLMVKAGYNPVAMITMLNKIVEEPAFWYERIGSSRTRGTDRLACVYEYIYVKYPAYLVDNDYKNNLFYQNFLLTSKTPRELVKQKYNTQNIVPVKNPKKKKTKKESAQ